MRSKDLGDPSLRPLARGEAETCTGRRLRGQIQHLRSGLRREFGHHPRVDARRESPTPHATSERNDVRMAVRWLERNEPQESEHQSGGLGE